MIVSLSSTSKWKRFGKTLQQRREDRFQPTLIVLRQRLGGLDDGAPENLLAVDHTTTESGSIISSSTPPRLRVRKGGSRWTSCMARTPSRRA